MKITFGTRYIDFYDLPELACGASVRIPLSKEQEIELQGTDHRGIENDDYHPVIERLSDKTLHVRITNVWAQCEYAPIEAGRVDRYALAISEEISSEINDV